MTIKPIQKITFEECSFKEATHFSLAGQTYSIAGQTASKLKEEVSLRLEFDRWADFHSRDFTKVGIKSLKPKNLKPKEFIGKIVEIESHLCIIVPKGFEADEYKCIEIVRDESSFSPLNLEIKYNSVDPHWYIQDSNGYLWGRFSTKEDAQAEIDILMY